MRRDRYNHLYGKRKKIYYILGIIEVVIMTILTILFIPIAIMWEGLKVIKEIPCGIIDVLGIRRNEWYITKLYRNYCLKKEKNNIQ